MSTGTSKLKRRPIRGAIFGLLIGIGTAALLIMYAVIAFGTLTPFLVIGGGVILGILWGLFGPAKRRKLPPSRIRSIPTATTPPIGKPGKAQNAAESAGQAAREGAADDAAAGADAAAAADAAAGGSDAAKAATDSVGDAAKDGAQAAESAAEDIGEATDGSAT